MSRFELSLSPSYVPDWGIIEALRELFQNALDQEAADPNNAMSYEWLGRQEIFTISSRSSVLEKSSLLMGYSEKSKDSRTIGKFGEGYKLALLVLTRLGHKVTVYNYMAKEVWEPKIIKSRRYGTDLLVVDTKKHIFTSVPDSNLTFVIENFDCFAYDELVEHTLFMQPEYMKLDTSKGEILTDPKHAGKLFVSGLYITTVDAKVAFKGYNFKPEVISLDRDRRLVDSFNLKWKTADMWSEIKDHAIVRDLVLSEKPDVEYLNSHSYSVSLADNVFSSFQSANGLNSVPVSNQQELNAIKETNPTLKPIIVSASIINVMERSVILEDLKCTTKTNEILTPLQKIEELISEYLDDLPVDFVESLESLLNELAS